MAREGTKTAAAIAVMVKYADKPMEEVLPFIAKVTGHDIPHARNYYVWCVRKGVAPGIIPARAPKAAKAKFDPVKAKKNAKAIEAKILKPKKPEAPKKSAEEIDRIKAANMARMKSVLGKVKQTVRKDEDAPVFAESDSFASPAFLTKDEVTALV